MNMMFPGITEVKVIRKSDGESRIVTHSSMKDTLSKEKFKMLSHDIFMWGEFENSTYKVVAYTQVSDYDRDTCFM